MTKVDFYLTSEPAGSATNEISPRRAATRPYDADERSLAEDPEREARANSLLTPVREAARKALRPMLASTLHRQQARAGTPEALDQALALLRDSLARDQELAFVRRSLYPAGSRAEESALPAEATAAADSLELDAHAQALADALVREWMAELRRALRSEEGVFLDAELQPMTEHAAPGPGFFQRLSLFGVPEQQLRQAMSSIAEMCVPNLLMNLPGDISILRNSDGFVVIRIDSKVAEREREAAGLEAAVQESKAALEAALKKLGDARARVALHGFKRKQEIGAAADNAEEMRKVIGRLIGRKGNHASRSE